MEANRPTPQGQDPARRYRAWLRRAYVVLGVIWVVLAIREHTRDGLVFETWGAYAFAVLWFSLWAWSLRADRRDSA